MSGIYGLSREAVRVKVKKHEGNQAPDFRKFSVDPQITSFEVLQSILGKAFDIKGDFAISYKLYDVHGDETYMPLLSDWELDAAFLKAHNSSLASNGEPCLCLRVDLKPFEESADDWEIRSNLPVIAQIRTGNAQEAKPAPRLHGIINQMGKTLNMVQRAFNFVDESSVCLQPPRPPLSDSEFRKFLDPVGQIMHTKELRSTIYFGGIDPSLRKVVWKHILNVYPDGMSGKERMEYIKRKASEYEKLRETWKAAVARGPVVGELAYTTGMVRKDVLRTDRHHKFYAGNDDNQNIASLFNILTTYALNHPKVSYCQGMSDLASPLLVTMGDEAHAYICFCALMSRLCSNFMLDGIAMTQKFTHLAEGLLYYDPEFYTYLKRHQADDLLFCYRWLLLEMKREFAFDDALRMLEVLWSSLPADPPTVELKLFDCKFQSPLATPPISPLVKAPRENAYTKVCALRRQSSSISLVNYSARKISTVQRQNHSLDETIGRHRSAGLEVRNKQQSLDDSTLAHKGNNHVNVDVSPHSPKSDELRPRSVSPLESKSDSVVMNNKINMHRNGHNASLSSSMTSLIRGTKRGHFKDLKERIVAGKMELFASLDRLDLNRSIKEEEVVVRANKGKVVKNLNEFLHLAAINKSKIADRLARVGGSFDGDTPKIMLTRSSFDESESSRSSAELTADKRPSSTSNSGEDTVDGYSPDDSHEYFPLTTSVTKELKLEIENFDRHVFGHEKLINSDASDATNKVCSSQSERTVKTRALGGRVDDVFVWENPLHKSSPNICARNMPAHIDTPDEQAELESDEVKSAQTPTKAAAGDAAPMPLTNSCEEVTELPRPPPTMLPPPTEFGGGNPFLMFLCITVLLQHRDQILAHTMDYNEMAMHFDKMVRKHNVNKVLNQARQMYAGYIKQHTLAQHRIGPGRMMGGDL